MSGTVIIGMGIALTGAAVILFGVGVIYQKTAGRQKTKQHLTVQL